MSIKCWWSCCFFQVLVRSDGLITAPGLELWWPCCCARGWHVSQGRNRNTTLTKHVEDKTTVEETINTTYMGMNFILRFRELLHPVHFPNTSCTRRRDWTINFPRQFPHEIFPTTDLWPALRSFAFKVVPVSLKRNICQTTYWLLTICVQKDSTVLLSFIVAFLSCLCKYSLLCGLSCFGILCYYNNLFYIMHFINVLLLP